MMKIFNTLTNQLDEFIPQNNDGVSLYTCGPTVYSEPLIGNWVAYIRWDILVRTLNANGHTVKRVMNITDVGHLVSDGDDGEDKMQKGARRDGTTAWAVAERYTNRFLEGMTELNLLPPEILSKATEHIDEQVELIKQLEEKGHTYSIDDGVYFDTKTFSTYADFARLDLEAMRAGARVSYNSQKRNPSDFALWKFSPMNEHRDMEWDSPWGRGFPGWHIECSAMALKYLGETLDIHTGGIDHIPVHHTNEIAQSEATTGKRFANYWLHANFLKVNGTKISKSLQNGFTLVDLKNNNFSALDFRMFVLQSHYRTESNFTWDNLSAASARLGRWKSIAVLRHQMPSDFEKYAAKTQQFNEKLTKTKEIVLDALNSDLNSPRALSYIDEMLDAVEQTQLASLSFQALTDFFVYIDDLLGLKLIDTTPDITEEQKQIISERSHARSDQQWERSDQLRKHLASNGIGVNDTSNGTLWYYL